MSSLCIAAAFAASYGCHRHCQCRALFLLLVQQPFAFHGAGVLLLLLLSLLTLLLVAAVVAKRHVAGDNLLFDPKQFAGLIGSSTAAGIRHFYESVADIAQANRRGCAQEPTL